MRSLSVAVVVMALSAITLSQTAAEYGTVLSRSATGATALGSAVGRTTSRTAGAVVSSSGRASQSRHGVVTVRGHASRGDVLEPAMRANRQKLEASAGASASTLQIASVPSKTAIYVDGLVTAYAPAELRLPAGKHSVELRHPAFLLWRQDVSVAAGQMLKLEPKLTMANKNQVVVSFDN
ncbi:MAG: PEGA domain-containing protein [Terriglobales bacterium]